MKPLPLKFYRNDDALEVAQELIGKVLCSDLGGQRTEGIIYETEAYCGVNDRACHAWPNRLTPRTEVFFKKGGIAYVYLCYGIHGLFNIITGSEGLPRAILIRAVYPIANLDLIKERRNYSKNLADGPGKLTEAFGISRSENGLALTKKNGLWVEDRNISLSYKATPRIGIDYAGEDAKLPWRFVGEDLAALSSYQS